MQSPESSPIIEMAKAKPEKGSKKPEKSEKTQEQLREALKKRFGVLTSDTKLKLDEYDQMLIDDSFEDKDGEVAGTGEKRKEIAQSKIEGMMNRAEKMKKTLDGNEMLPQSTSQIEASYTHINPKTHAIERQENITIDIEKKTQEFLDFYKKTNIDLPPDFSETILDIWERNSTEIQQAMEQNGFDDILLVPANIPLSELSEKMKMGKGYSTGSNFTQGGGFAGAVSQNTDKPRIILYHKTETLSEITAKTGLDVHLNITGADVEKLYKQNPNGYISTLEDFLVLEKKYFEETGKHLSDWRKNSAHWLPGTKSGTRLVDSSWNPDDDKLYVNADDLDYRNEHLGVRPFRSFF